MNRNQAKEFYPILQAYAEGKVIECRTKPSFIEGLDVPNNWMEMKEIEFWNNTEYRIKSEPKYRPFSNAEECWAEMQKHQPFGWIKDKRDNNFIIEKVDSRGYIEICDESTCTFKYIFEDYTFADGILFGIKE